MRSAIRFHLGLMTLLSVSLHGSSVLAQSVTFRWVDPAGGSYEDDQNWTPQGVPTGGDIAIFDLKESFVVSTGANPKSGGLGSLQIANSNVELLIAGSVQSLASADTLTIGDAFSGTTAFPGRLELRSSNTVPPSTGLLIEDLRLGSAFRGSKLTIGPGTRIETIGRVVQRTNATLAFPLGADEDFSSSARLLILGDTKASSILEGTLDIGPDKSELPPIGTVTTLLQGDFPFFSNGYPSLELVVLRPTRGRSIAVEAAFPFLGGPILESRIDFADSLSSIDFSEESSLGAAPTALEAADLSGDLRDDLIVLLADGTVSVYPSSGTGGFGTPITYAIGGDPRDVSTGDFDDDGTIDLAIVCDGDDSLRFLLNPDEDPAALVAGPIEILDDSPVGSATTTFFANPFSLSSSRGVSVTTKGSGGGKVGLYRLSGASVTKVGSDTDVGDDPGTTDPIDDEGKKDDTSPIGVGGLGSVSNLAGGEIIGPVLFVLDIIADGEGFPYDLTSTLPLSGYPIDFVSADIDRDTVVEAFVITDAGQLDLLEVGVSVRRPVGSFDLEGEPTAIAIAQIEGDIGPNDPLEVVIGFDSPPRIDVYRVGRSFATEGFAGGGFLSGRYVFERVLSRTLSETPIDVVASDSLASGEDGEVYIGATGDGGPAINIGDYESESIPACVFADLDDNGVVGGFDLAIMLGSWGPCSGCPADINGDGRVDAADIGLLFIAWGPCEL